MWRYIKAAGRKWPESGCLEPSANRGSPVPTGWPGVGCGVGAGAGIVTWKPFHGYRVGARRYNRDMGHTSVVSFPVMRLTV